MNDLHPVGIVTEFGPHDSILVSSAQLALSRHTWYLTEELTLFITTTRQDKRGGEEGPSLS